MKKVSLIPALVALLFTGVVSAQSYYPNVSYGGSCVNITSNLSYGSRGSEVTKLQEFLVAQNYPGGGSWMITGYYGNATVQAVRNFQQTAGLSMTGYADAQTRTAIQSRTCGAPPVLPSYLPTTPVTTYPYSTPSTYPTTPYTIGNAPTVGSLSIYTGVTGTIVNIQGSNFDQYTNAVRFGGVSVNASSNAGTQLSFVIPAVAPGTYQVSVQNARGTSNSMPFTVTAAGPNTCGPWGYGPTCSQLELTYMNPPSGATNAAVTIYGSGFSHTGNTIHFGQGIITNVSSHDGRSVSFTVSSTLAGYGSAQVVVGTYPVYVTNAYGQSSNALSFNVTSTGGSSHVPPVITGITGPTSLSTGAQGTWTLTLNTVSSTYVTTTVRWGDENTYGYAQNVQPTTLLQNQQTITLTHTYSVPGTYAITFTVVSPSGTSVSTATVVVGGGGTSYLSLASLNPTSGRPGTVVTLSGSGFSSSDNTVHFGVGGSRNVPAYGSTSLQFTVPSYVSPCDLIQSGYLCGSPVTSVTPGTYPVYVTNNAGATNILYFTVTQ